jgi:GNAT superfamily N-acetyltransferase
MLTARTKPPVLEFGSLGWSEIPEVIELLAQGRPADFAQCKSPIFEWQFRLDANSHNDDFVVARLDGRIVATLGTMPVEINYQGAPRRAFWIVDIFVSPDHRGQGIGRALIDHVGRRAQAQLVFGMSDASQAMFAGRGWPTDPHMRVFFLHLSEPGVLGLIKNARSRLASTRSPDSAGAPRMASCERVGAAELDELWGRVSSQFVSGVARTGAYLQWRYADAPNACYRWMAHERDGVLAAVAIFRHDPTESVLADWCGPLDDPELLCNVMAAVVDELAARKTARIRCEANHPAIQRALASVGFVATRFESRFRLNIPGGESDATDWFLMTGDSDNDMLVRPAGRRAASR